MGAKRKRNLKFQFLERFDKQLKQLKTIVSHVGLYLGLIAYTALGAMIFQMLEHPVEREKLTTMQDLIITERESLLNMIFNLTSKLDDRDLRVLKAFVNYGQLTYSTNGLNGLGSNGNNHNDDYSNFDYKHLKTIMLTTNRIMFESPARAQLQASAPDLDKIITKIDKALLDYEKIVAVASQEGIEISNKHINYKWTYFQSVFFSSTIITTVGYGNIAPVTVGGRAFCIVFAIIGIPFTLSVIADVGQIFATLVSAVWAKMKPLLTPIMDKIKKLHKEFKLRQRRKRQAAKALKRNEPKLLAALENGSAKHGDDPIGSKRGSTLISGPGQPGRFDAEEGGEVHGVDKHGPDAEEEEDEEEEEEEEEEDPTESMGIGANIVMAFVALGFLGIFLSFGSSLFTQFEEWTFFEAFYFCFITMTTIGFGDIVPKISADNTGYMLLCMIYILVGLAFTSTIIELVRRQYAESWRKMQELRAQIQAQLKLADHLRKMGEQGKDIEGMDVDLNQLRANLSKFKRFGNFDINDLDWIDKRKKVKAITIFFYETSV